MPIPLHEVTAKTPCDLCGDPIGTSLDAGHRLSWWTGEDGHHYHQACRDAMRIGYLEAEVGRLREIKTGVRELFDLFRKHEDYPDEAGPVIDKLCRLLNAEPDSAANNPPTP